MWLGSDRATVSWEAGGGGNQCGAFTDWSYRLEVEAGNMTRLLSNITSPPVQVGGLVMIYLYFTPLGRLMTWSLAAW